MAEPKPNDIKQYMAIKQPKQRYYTIEEVMMHNTASDCWVVLFGEVYDLTALIQKNIDSKPDNNLEKETRPLIEAAGSDITYWFDSNSREPRVKVDVDSGKREFYCPRGEYLQLRT